MSLRHAARRVAASVAATAAAGALVALAFASPAGATTAPDEGLEVATAQAQTPYTAGAPFDSGQKIDVSLGANTVFDGSVYSNNASAIKIVECAAPNGVVPTLPSACDGNTIGTDFPNSDGSFDYLNDNGSGYPVYYLPDSRIGDSPSGPKCGNTLATECILYIGNSQLDFTQPHVWSQPFLVNPDPTDSGIVNPGDGTPEVPMAIILPVAAMGLLGSVVVVRRRRAARSA